MKTSILQRTTLFLLLLAAGHSIAWSADIATLPYYAGFGNSSTEPFYGGDVASGTNVSDVFRVTNTTATAYFANAYPVNTNETVTMAFTAYHGYLGGSNTSSVQLCNSDGVVLVSYTYNYNNRAIEDVIIGGTTASGFSSFAAGSYSSNAQLANGLVGNGRPYLNDGNYNPYITMSVNGDGTAKFTFWLGCQSHWESFTGSIGSAKRDIKSIRVTSNCNNSDRTICIDNLYVSTSYYSNDYESGAVDWATATGGRYTPVILAEGSNHYLSVKQDERYNNGTTLSSTSLGVPAGSSYQMTFDLKLSSSNDQSPTSFRVYDAANTGIIFSLTATGKSVDTWKVNNGDAITLSGTNIGTGDITLATWYSVTILRAGTNTWVTIKNKETGNAIEGANELLVTSSETGGIGKMEFVTMRNYANFALDNVEVTPMLDWSVNSTTVNIKDVGESNPNMIDGMPFIKVRNNAITSLYSSNDNVARYVEGRLLIKGVGTTTVVAIDDVGYSASCTLTVTGTEVTPTQTGNTLTFDNVGYIVNNTTGSGRSHTLDTGLTIEYGASGETAIVVESGIGTVLKVIDTNAYSHPNLTGGVIPPSNQWGGTFLKLTAVHSGYLTVTGNVSTTATKLYLSDGSAVTADIDEEGHTLMATLTSGSVYYLYNVGDASSDYIPLVHAINYADPLFVNDNAVIEIPANGQYTIPAITGMTSPTYTLTKFGDLSNVSLGVSGNTLTGITAGGAVLIKAEEGGKTAYHLVTVAYKATAYPGHLWNFNEAGGSMTTSAVLKDEPIPTTSVTDDNNNSWTARFKNENTRRAPEWRLNRTVSNDNAVIVPETAGLLFNTGYQGFYLRNDNSSFKHVGIFRYGASFTIPFLKAGDIVELNWKHDASGSGSALSATHLKDLRNKVIPEDDTFLITESAMRNNDNHVGRYSFIVAEDGDVTFTLKDNGFTDILSVRIYQGPYQSTMRYINQKGNTAVPNTLLLDNAEDGYIYNYCNQLYSTATGPAFYVLKGYRAGLDNKECVTGSDAALSYSVAVDEDAYPVSAEEQERLYELRKNLVGFRMYNETWKSKNNAYNYGHIDAISGYGKVTIRMNNYTNDMKYLIGYTPDYTLTIGSKPHQTYPYTWDFGQISMQQALNQTDNVLTAIEGEGSKSSFSGMSATNWDKISSGDYLLNIKNDGQYGSQYVPGAILVSIDRALSNFPQSTSSTYAKDELDGLGVNGEVAMQIDHATSNWSRTAAVDKTLSLLSFKVEDYMYAKTTTTDEETGETIVTEWGVIDGTEFDAGNGKVQFANKGKIEESPYAACGFAYRSDQDAGNSKWILVKPSRAIVAGDVITVKTFTDMYPDSNTGVGIFATNAADQQVAVLPITQRYAEVTLSYTVAIGDAIVGKTEFYLNRATGGKTILISEVEITGSAAALPKLDKNLYAVSDLTLTLPDLNADGKQDWLYVSASVAPTVVTNATQVTEGTDGPDANSENHVYKYKVTSAGPANLTFAEGTKIYRIGVTHILKEIHPVGGVGWATESRDHAIDHGLTGYFTQNDVNAYTVSYDSYDLNTATVGLTPVYEDGHVAASTGIVLRLDETVCLDKANNGKLVPLFYPSYTRGSSTTPVDFPTNNMMYPNLTETRHYMEESGGYSKFILTNVHWTWTYDQQTQTLSSEGPKQAEAAGFYRLHIYNDPTKDTMAENTAYLRVPSSELPIAVWNLPTSSGAPIKNSIGIRRVEDGTTDVNELTLPQDRKVSHTDVEVWYSLDGIRLNGRPTKPGLYICNGRKVVVK